MSEKSGQKYSYIGQGLTNVYLYEVKSKSDLTKVYTIKVKIVHDDHINTDTSIDIECECKGYKHRGKCWHIDKIRGVIENNSYCIMCLTPFLDIELRNSISEINAYDQDNHKILINKAGKMSCHEDCIIYLGEFESYSSEWFKIQDIYKTFYNKEVDW